MPGWHKQTKELVALGKLAVAGLAPEQHGDRMKLFLQWKEMSDMDVMLDSYNQLGLKAVPTTLLIDESGVVRFKNPKMADLEKFLATPPVLNASTPEPFRERTVNLTSQTKLDEGIRKQESTTATLDFQLGVAHRKAFDSAEKGGEIHHFQRAVFYWRRALERDPSNYIWRRRLQQYGPRLDKPYPFYDWVKSAREDLQKQGIIPHPLAVEPTGAEIAKPSKTEEFHLPGDPDPDHKLPEDSSGLIGCRVVRVPHTSKPEQAMRIQLTLTPNSLLKAKWNDVPEAPTIRVLPGEGWRISVPEVIISPDTRESRRLMESSSRTVEFEVQRTDARSLFTCALFYQVCHGDTQTCQLLRRTVEIDSKRFEKP